MQEKTIPVVLSTNRSRMSRAILKTEGIDFSLYGQTKEGKKYTKKRSSVLAYFHLKIGLHDFIFSNLRKEFY